MRSVWKNRIIYPFIYNRHGLRRCYFFDQFGGIKVHNGCKFVNVVYKSSIRGFRISRFVFTKQLGGRIHMARRRRKKKN
jgi:ribosomal protein S19